MPIPLSSRSPDYALCAAGECEACAPSALERDASFAGQALGSALLDVQAMAGLRRLLGQRGGIDLQACGDDQVLALVGADIQRGRLQLCRRDAAAQGTRPVDPGGADLGKTIAPPPGGPPAPASAPVSSLRAPPPTPAPAPAPAEEPTVEIDASAQAATLIAASRDGVPFCEECEKARRAREAATA